MSAAERRNGGPRTLAVSPRRQGSSTLTLTPTSRPLPDTLKDGCAGHHFTWSRENASMAAHLEGMDETEPPDPVPTADATRCGLYGESWVDVSDDTRHFSAGGVSSSSLRKLTSET